MEDIFANDVYVKAMEELQQYDHFIMGELWETEHDDKN